MTFSLKLSFGICGRTFLKRLAGIAPPRSEFRVATAIFTFSYLTMVPDFKQFTQRRRLRPLFLHVAKTVGEDCLRSPMLFRGFEEPPASFRFPVSTGSSCPFPW